MRQENIFFKFYFTFYGRFGKFSTSLLKNLLPLFCGLIIVVSDCLAKGIRFLGGVGICVFVTEPRLTLTFTHRRPTDNGEHFPKVNTAGAGPSHPCNVEFKNTRSYVATPSFSCLP